ncbi:MAG: cytosine deaminase [Cyanobacteria bacterium P01_A01_bin.37]
MIPDVLHYRLVNCHVSACLLDIDANVIEAARIYERSPVIGDHLCQVDIAIDDGQITAIAPTGQLPPTPFPPLNVDLKGKQVWPCFVDMHTHLDKGHTWERSPNHDRTFDGALTAIRSDSAAYWQEEDVYRRMEFGLKCSYAHGTSAIRTHIDSFGEQAHISFSAFKQLQAEWGDRINLQAVCLVTLDYFLTSNGEALADLMTTVPGGILGGVVFPDDALDHHLDRVFSLAQERNLALDFHADESGNPNHKTLRHIAQAAIRHQFSNPIICGHCCSLAVQPPDEVEATLTLVKEAGIGIVSLPLCNLYLQDRNQTASRHFSQTAVSSTMPLHTGNSPRWRGMTLLHELKALGIPVAIASDNCRDPFFGFGDHDALEVFTQSVRIAHLDAPYGDWPGAIARIPANLMGLPTHGRIGVGSPANLVIFKARTFSELLSRPQSDRIVLRQGREIDTTLPDYEELDDLIHMT